MIKQAQTYKLLQRHGQMLLVLLFLIAGAFSLGLNSGLRYARFHSTYIIELSADAQVATLDEFAGAAGVIKLDRDLRQLWLQDITPAAFQETLLQVQARAGESVVRGWLETPILPVNLLARVLNLALIGLVLLAVVIYWQFVRPFSAVTQKVVWQLVPELIVVNFVVLLLQLGMLSLLSIFYPVSMLGLVAIGGNLMLLGLWQYLALRQVSMQALAWTDVKDLRNELGARLAQQKQKLLALAGLFTVIAMLCLGVNYVLEGAVALIALWLAAITVVQLPIYLFQKDWSQFRRTGKAAAAVDAGTQHTKKTAKIKPKAGAKPLKRDRRR